MTPEAFQNVPCALESLFQFWGSVYNGYTRGAVYRELHIAKFAELLCWELWDLITWRTLLTLSPPLYKTKEWAHFHSRSMIRIFPSFKSWHRKFPLDWSLKPVWKTISFQFSVLVCFLPKIHRKSIWANFELSFQECLSISSYKGFGSQLPPGSEACFYYLNVGIFTAKHL